MRKYEHGGNVRGAAKRLNLPVERILDLSTCVADSFPGEVLPVLQNHSLLKILPEPYSVSFSAGYFAKYGRQALLTSGTTEVISALCQLYRGKRCAVLSPTYSDYERHAEINGMETLFWGGIDEAGADIFFLCNPNNPTGSLISREDILAAAKKAPETLFVIDESYMPFVTDANEYTLENSAGGNIAVLRSFSKVFCLPGLRIGYITSGERLIEKIKEIISPWSVVTQGQAVAEILLDLPQLPVSGLQTGERAEFFEKLSSLPYLSPLPSNTHFFLCRLNGVSASALCETLLEHRVLIRDCSNIRGLGSDYVRISMREGWRKLFSY